MSEKFAVIGHGVVGRVTGAYYQQLWRVDSYIAIDVEAHFEIPDLAECSIIFICIPADFRDPPGRLSGLALYSWISYLRDHAAPGCKIVIRSTIDPTIWRTCVDMLHDKHHLAYLPEFGDDRVLANMRMSPPRTIGSDRSVGLHSLFQVEVVSPEVAITLKLATNAFYAAKLTFFEQLYDAVGDEQTYEEVARLMARDYRVGNSHRVIGQDGYRGYAGKCLPKDVKGLLGYLQQVKSIEFPLLADVDRFNERLLDRQKKPRSTSSMSESVSGNSDA